MRWISIRASLLQCWPFNKSIFNRDLWGAVHYWSLTGSSASVESPQLWFPSTKPAHYCWCEEPVGFIMCFPHWALKRLAESQGKKGTFGGKGGRVAGLCSLARAWRKIWLISALWGLTCTRCNWNLLARRAQTAPKSRVQTVVNTRRQILWLAGQATAQVDCDSISKHPDTAGPCLAGYTCVYVRVCVGDAWNDGLYFILALTWNIIQDDRSRAFINGFLNKCGTPPPNLTEHRHGGILSVEEQRRVKVYRVQRSPAQAVFAGSR